MYRHKVAKKKNAALKRGLHGVRQSRSGGGFQSASMLGCRTTSLWLLETRKLMIHTPKFIKVDP